MKFRSLAASSACVLVLLVLVPAAHAQALSLTGEQFRATGLAFPLPPGATPGEVNVTGTCNPDGSSTFNFTASGPAIGPYSGSYVETGSFTVEGPPDPDGLFVLSDFQAQFTIQSAAGSVTGTKAFTGPAPGASTACSPEPLRVGSGLAPSHYEAEIETPGGRFTTRRRVAEQPDLRGPRDGTGDVRGLLGVVPDRDTAGARDAATAASPAVQGRRRR